MADEVDEQEIVDTARERVRAATAAAGLTLRMALDVLTLAHERARDAGPVIAEHCLDGDADAVAYAVEMMASPHGADVQAIRALASDLLNAAGQLGVEPAPALTPTGDVERRIRRVVTVVRSLEQELAELYDDARALDANAAIGPGELSAAMLTALTSPSSGLAYALSIMRTAAVSAVPEVA